MSGGGLMAEVDGLALSGNVLKRECGHVGQLAGGAWFWPLAPVGIFCGYLVAFFIGAGPAIAMFAVCVDPYGYGFVIGPNSGAVTGAPPLGGGHVGNGGSPAACASTWGSSFIS